jgi:uncharacterized iron-regulated membrane protein
VWLWWPTFRRWAFGFRIRWARPFFVVNYDLHRVIGICSLPLVLVLSLTGAILVFYDVGGRMLYALFLTTPEAAAPALPPDLPEADGAALPLTLNDAATLAMRLAPQSVASSSIANCRRAAQGVAANAGRHATERRLMARADRSRDRHCGARHASTKYVVGRAR